jgi:hypothetical protein
MTQLRPEKEVVQWRHQAEPSWMDISMGHLCSCGLFEQDQPDYDDDEEEEDQCELEQPQEQPSDEPAAEEPKDEVLSLLVFSSRTDK